MLVDNLPTKNTVEAIRATIGSFPFQPGHPEHCCDAQGQNASEKGYFHCTKLDTVVTGFFCDCGCCGLKNFQG
jgi:hypothetical protein